MNSLSELNGFASLSLDVVDNRPSKVIFDRMPPLGPINQINEITSQTPTITAGINIIEVVNYSVANVRYRVTINTSGSPLLTGSTISWGSLPSGVVLSVSGSSYTLSNINTPSIWQQVKNFTWNLPANYASCPNWSLTVEIIYYDSSLGRDVSRSWLVYDPDNYFVAELSTSTAMTCVGQDARLFNAALTTETFLFFEPEIFEGIIETFVSSATLECNARLKPDDDLLAVSNIVINANYIVRLESKNNQINSSLSCGLTGILINMIDRSYIANNENLLFAIDTPFIDDADTATTATFNITLTSSLGKFSYSDIVEPVSNFSYTGTRSQINNIFNSIRFYPTKGSSASGILTYTQSKSNVLQVSANINLTGVSGVYSTTSYYRYTQGGQHTFTPPNAAVIYGYADILIVAGGGGGSRGGGGGGGGVKEEKNIVLSHTAYPLYVGPSGNGNDQTSTDTNYILNGSSGVDSTGFGYTINGGTGGRNSRSGLTYILNGGASGIPTSTSNVTRYSGGTSNSNAGYGGAGASYNTPGAALHSDGNGNPRAGGVFQGAGFLSSIEDQVVSMNIINSGDLQGYVRVILSRALPENTRVTFTSTGQLPKYTGGFSYVTNEVFANRDYFLRAASYPFDGLTCLLWDTVQNKFVNWGDIINTVQSGVHSISSIRYAYGGPGNKDVESTVNLTFSPPASGVGGFSGSGGQGGVIAIKLHP